MHTRFLIVLSAAVLSACDAPVVIRPEGDVQKVVQTALIQAKPGDVIEFAEGVFDFTRTLSLDVENVTLRGAGADRTILRFAEQVTGSGGEGLLVTAGSGHAPGGVTIEDLAIEDTRGDALKVTGVDGVTIRRVRVEWTAGPGSDNGAYGLYPVESRNVLIEDCTAIGASDAGIYVGQCENIIVRRNTARQNVAGIEIENSVGADVYENLATDNTGGMLVFTLPNLPKKDGRQCRVFNNRLVANNRENFAKPGQMVANLPPGGGLIIIAHDQVEVFGNTFEDNATANLSIMSFRGGRRGKAPDPEYDRYCEAISIYDNTFTGGGTNPVGQLGDVIREHFGTNGPDIVYDGVVDPEKLVDGKLPDALGIYVENNGDATFANLDMGALAAGGTPKVSTDVAAYAGRLPSLPAIRIEGVE